jgi:hypothetical protein
LQQLTHYNKLNNSVGTPVISPRGNQLVDEHANTTGNIWMLDLDQPQ